MDLPTDVLLLGSLAIAAVAAVLIAFAARARPIGGRPSSAAEAEPAEKGQRAESAAPAKPGAAKAKAARPSQRERLAAAFAAQIEDVLRASLLADPLLAGRDVDLGTAPDGSLEIAVDGQIYGDISHIPDRRVRDALAKAVQEWKAGTWQGEGES